MVIDVGTNNEKLLSSKLYMGLRQRRLEGKPFVDLMDEFVSAVTQRYPHAVLQFEDFAIDRAQPLLERYRYDHLVFNDDIQARLSPPFLPPRVATQPFSPVRSLAPLLQSPLHCAVLSTSACVSACMSACTCCNGAGGEVGGVRRRTASPWRGRSQAAIRATSDEHFTWIRGMGRAFVSAAPARSCV